jgi:hypothetical protein
MQAFYPKTKSPAQEGAGLIFEGVSSATAREFQRFFSRKIGYPKKFDYAEYFRPSTLAVSYSHRLIRRLPSPLASLTSVFGMRTGVTPPLNHQSRMPKIKNAGVTQTRTILRPAGLRISRLTAFNNKLLRLSSSFALYKREHRSVSTTRLNTLLCVHLWPINVIISHGS